MKSLLGLVLLALVALVNPSVSHAQQNQSNTPLNNAAVIKLAKAGFKDKTIISIIAVRLPNFDLSPERMIELKHDGVSEKVIMAMLARQQGSDMPDDGWTDDAFFNSSLDPKSSGTSDPNSGANSNPSNGSNPNNGSTDIFGNSSGSKSRTKTRGNGNGGLDSDTVTTGSATVRILRPPTEANGGGPAKLEKTKSLTNRACGSRFFGRYDY